MRAFLLHVLLPFPDYPFALNKKREKDEKSCDVNCRRLGITISLQDLENEE